MRLSQVNSTRVRPRLLAGLAAGLLPWRRQRTSAAPNAPDIVVLLLNDARAGDETALPQAMARLRDGGTTFPNFFLTTPLCGPSRATIFTGLYAHNTGVHENTDGKHGGWVGFARHGNRGRTTAVLLQQAGYHTVSVGEYINGQQPGHGKEPGWDVGPVARKKHGGNGKGGRHHKKPDKVGGQKDRQRTAAAVAAIERAPADQSLYLHFGFGIPHVPVRPVPPYEGQFAGAAVDRDDPAFAEADTSDKPRYMRSLGRLGSRDEAWLDGQHQKRLECLLEVDDYVVQIWDALESRGRLDNTYVFLFTDNGYLLGQHRYYGKHVPYDGSVRMPLYAYGPRFAAGATDERLVGNVDVAPTLVELAGATAPQLDGASLLSPHERDVMLIEFLAPNVNSMNWPGPRTTIARYAGLRTASQLYVEYQGREREYYDHAADPHETQNLLAGTPSPAVQATVDALAARLAELRGCRGNACP